MSEVDSLFRKYSLRLLVKKTNDNSAEKCIFVVTWRAMSSLEKSWTEMWTMELLRALQSREDTSRCVMLQSDEREAPDE